MEHGTHNFLTLNKAGMGFINNASITIESGGKVTVVSDSTNNGPLTNRGTFTHTSGTFENTGAAASIVNISPGVFTTNSTVNNRAPVTITSGSFIINEEFNNTQNAFINNGGTLTIGSAGSFNNSDQGEFTNGADGTFTNNGTFDNSTNNGTTLVFDGTVNNNNTITSSNIAGGFGFQIPVGAVFTNAVGSLFRNAKLTDIRGTFNNSGTVNLPDGNAEIYVFNGATLNNQLNGTVTNGGVVTLAGGSTSTNSGLFNNLVLFREDPGALLVVTFTITSTGRLTNYNGNSDPDFAPTLGNSTSLKVVIQAGGRLYNGDNVLLTCGYPGRINADVSGPGSPVLNECMRTTP